MVSHAAHLLMTIRTAQRSSFETKKSKGFPKRSRATTQNAESYFSPQWIGISPSKYINVSS